MYLYKIAKIRFKYLIKYVLFKLTLEIKSLLNDLDNNSLTQPVSEINIHDNCLKRGIDDDMEQMYVEDLAALQIISEKTILRELNGRLKAGHFQTFIGDILLILNPTERPNIYGNEVLLCKFLRIYIIIPLLLSSFTKNIASNRDQIMNHTFTQ